MMHQAEPYGHLVVNGLAIPPDTLARMVGASKREAAAWLGELEAAGVFSKEGSTIVSRRMVRDEEIRKARAEGGKLGGNPALKDNPKVGNKVNHTPNLKPTPSTSSSSSRSKEAAAPPDPIWGEGLQVLTAANVPIEGARTFLGKCLKEWSADVVLDALREAKGTADPKAYSLRLLQGKQRKPGRETDYTRGAR
jgi:hypothetical protein